MRCTVFFGTLLMAVILLETSVSAEVVAVAGDGGTEDPTIQKGVISVHLRERGALLIESFKGDTVDEEKWRIQLNELDGLYPDDVYDVFME